MDPQWQRRYGVWTDAYRLPGAENERAELARQIGADGYRLLETVSADTTSPWLWEIPAVVILRTVWLQQYYRVDDGDKREVTLRDKDDLPPNRDRITSPYDVDSRYGMKRGSG